MNGEGRMDKLENGNDAGQSGMEWKEWDHHLDGI